MADLDATQAHLVTIQHFGRVYDLIRSRFPDSHGLQAAVGESIRRVVIGWLLQATASVDSSVMERHLSEVVDLVHVYDTIKAKDLIDDGLKSTIASQIHLAWTEVIPQEVQRQIDIMETEGGLFNVQRAPSHSVASGSTASASESEIMSAAKTHGQVSNEITMAPGLAVSGPVLSKSESSTTPHPPATSKTDCKGQVSNAETDALTSAMSGRALSSPKSFFTPYSSILEAGVENYVSNGATGQALNDKTGVPAITTPIVGSREAAGRWNIYSFEHPHRPNSQKPISRPSTSTNVCVHNDTATGPSAAVVPYLLPHLRKTNLGIPSSSAAATLSQDHGSKGSMTHAGASLPVSSPSASLEPRNHARIQDVNLAVASASKTTQLSQGDDSSDPTNAAVPSSSKLKTVSTAPRPLSVRPTPHDLEVALFSPLGLDAVYISVDFEGVCGADKTSEIGISFFDARDATASIVPGVRGHHLFSLIHSDHFILSDHPHYRHSCTEWHHQGDVGRFAFGASGFIKEKEVSGICNGYTEDVSRRNLREGEEKRVVVLCSFASYREEYGMRHYQTSWFTKADFCWDIQLSDFAVAIGQRLGKQKLRVSDMTDGLGINTGHGLLHNGGNDATFGLQALIAGALLTDNEFQAISNGVRLSELPKTWWESIIGINVAESMTRAETTRAGV